MFDIDKVDKLIDKYTEKNLKNLGYYSSAESVTALAELISARSKYKHEKK